MCFIIYYITNSTLFLATIRVTQNDIKWPSVQINVPYEEYFSIIKQFRGQSDMSACTCMGVCVCV